MRRSGPGSCGSRDGVKGWFTTNTRTPMTDPTQPQDSSAPSVLVDLKTELMDFYVYDEILNISGSISKSCLTEQKWDDNTPWHFSLGLPPDEEINYKVPLSYILHRLDLEGQAARKRRAWLLVSTYTLWQDVHRKRIQKDCGVDEINSQVFDGLRHYRNAVVHRKGRLDRHTTALTTFGKGDVIEPTRPQLVEIFKQLVSGINEIGTTYYGADPGFQWGAQLSQCMRHANWVAIHPTVR